MSDPDDMKVMTFRAKKEEIEKFAQGVDSKSAKGRRIVRHHNKAKEELDVADEMEEMTVMILKTYRNALIKNKQTIQNQIDKIDDKLSKYEDEEYEDDEVLLEVELDLVSKNL